MSALSACLPARLSSQQAGLLHDRYIVTPDEFFSAAGNVMTNKLLTLLDVEEIFLRILAWLETMPLERAGVPAEWNLCLPFATLMGTAKFFRLHHGLYHPNVLRRRHTVTVNAEGDTVDVMDYNDMVEILWPAFDSIRSEVQWKHRMLARLCA